MRPFTQQQGRILVLAQENIDTDQIIPARFLTATTFEGMGEGAFADWRSDASGTQRPVCVLNEPRARHSPILVTGRNFGCGSSREHAPHALLDFGFRVVISSEIADIFRSNCQNVGLLPVVLPRDQHRQLLNMDGESITVDLEGQQVRISQTEAWPFEMDSFARYCLLNGMDRLDYLLGEKERICAYEVKHEH